MAQTNKLEATVRPQGGKGAARAVRREGKVPAVIYGGDEKTPETIALDHNELFKIIKRGRFLSTVFDIKVAATKASMKPSLPPIPGIRCRRSS